MLLDNRGDYSCADANGATPLHYASQNNHAVSLDILHYINALYRKSFLQTIAHHSLQYLPISILNTATVYCTAIVVIIW